MMGARILMLAWAVMIAVWAPQLIAARQPDPLAGLDNWVHRPLKPFPVTVWTNTSAGFTYPELTQGPFGIPALQSKLSLGLALAGGGLRAAAAAIGTLRALHMVSQGANGQLKVLYSDRVVLGTCHSSPLCLSLQLGLMKNISHMSCASGGCWAAVPYTYTSLPVDEILGTYTPPEAMTVDQVLSMQPGTLQEAVQQVNLAQVLATHSSEDEDAATCC